MKGDFRETKNKQIRAGCTSHRPRNYHGIAKSHSISRKFHFRKGLLCKSVTVSLVAMIPFIIQFSLIAWIMSIFLRCSDSFDFILSLEFVWCHIGAALLMIYQPQFCVWLFSKSPLTLFCFQLGIVSHEIGHAIGFHHEQSRPDRDDYVTIHLENVVSGAESNFNKYSWDQVTSEEVPYDIGSVMHYSTHVRRCWVVLLHSKSTRVSHDPERVHWGQTPFRVNDDPEISQIDK